MNLKRFRSGLLAAVGMAVSWFAGTVTQALAAFPERPITMVVPYGAGGGTDLAARLLANEMQKILGQPVVVKNDAGGGGAVALGNLFAGKPDGYTIAMGTASNTSIIPFATKVAYDPLKFTYIASYFGWPYVVVVHPSVPANNLNELVTWAKANPRKLIAVTTGGFNIHEVGIGLLSARSNGFEYRTLPTNSAAEGTARVLAGDANFASGSPVTYAKHIQAGTVKPIAIISDVSNPQLDALKVPNMRDVFGFELINTTVVIAPPNMPEDIRLVLEGAIKKAVQNPDVIKSLADLDFPVQFSPGPEALKVTQKLHDIYGPVVKKLLESK